MWYVIWSVCTVSTAIAFIVNDAYLVGQKKKESSFLEGDEPDFTAIIALILASILWPITWVSIIFMAVWKATKLWADKTD